MGEVRRMGEGIRKRYKLGQFIGVDVEAEYEINGKVVRIEVSIREGEEPTIWIKEGTFTYSEFNTLVKLVRQTVRRAKIIVRREKEKSESK